MNNRPRASVRLRAARVLRTHGVRGEVRVEALGGDARRFPAGTRLHAERADRVLTVRSVRAGGDGTVLLSFTEIDSVEAARPLGGEYLCVEPDAARQLSDGEWFVWQLVGLRAVTPDGEILGDVVDVEPVAGNDVLVVSTQGGARRFPMVREFVREVRIADGRVVLTPWPEDAA